MAKVSTIIPVYNGSKIIRRAIDSVLNQTYQVAELIIVDDGSTDNTGEIISEYVRIYGERIKYFKKMNEGPGKALEYGIRWAQGDYIALLDQDDYWFEKKLEKQMIQFETNPDIVLVSTDWCEGISSSGEEESVLQRSKYFDRNQFEQLLLENPICSPSVVVRKDVLLEVGFSEKNISYGPWDRPLWVKIAHRYPIRILREVLMWRNYSPDTLSMQKNYCYLQYFCWDHLLNYFNGNIPLTYQLLIKKNCAEKLYETAMYHFWRNEFVLFREFIKKSHKYYRGLLLKKPYAYLYFVPDQIIISIKFLKNMLIK